MREIRTGAPVSATTSQTRAFSKSMLWLCAVASLIALGSTAALPSEEVIFHDRFAAAVADAGPDQAVRIGETVGLDGTGSLHAHDQALVFAWAFVSRPDGSTAQLDGADTANPTFQADALGQFVVQLIVSAGGVSSLPDTVRITVTDEDSGGQLPPAPETVAPPLDQTVAYTVFSSTEFLYTGTNPIQTGVEPGTIDPVRVVVIRGQVNTRDGEPLPGVSITIKDRPEFGQTLSRADGRFDLAVNGGGWLTIDYARAGYLPSQRKVNTPWQDFVHAPEVALIPLDPLVTQINLSTLTEVVDAAGSIEQDADGQRQARVLFKPGTTAEMILPDGSVEPLDQLSVRASEYTVGPNGPAAMPGDLPANVGYTYAVELSADEALAVNASRVQFSQPVAFYVENFLGFESGGIVPMGYYDRDLAAWVPSENGRVIEIVGMAGDLVEIDIDGDGLANLPSELAEIGIDEAERRRLANIYQAGTSLWRVEIDHFTPWDCNWPYGPPDDVMPVDLEQPRAPEPGEPLPGHVGGDSEEEPCPEEGSIIACRTQSLGQSIALSGSRQSLHYDSRRVLGRKMSQPLLLTGPEVPDSLLKVHLEVNIAGRIERATFTPEPNLRFIPPSWVGADAYGRPVINSGVEMAIRVGHEYPVVYREPGDFQRSFSQVAQNEITGVRGRENLTIWQEIRAGIGAPGIPLKLLDGRANGLGGWSLGTHHAYALHSRVLVMGTGQQITVPYIGAIIETVAGTGENGSDGDGDGGPALEANLDLVADIAVGPNGDIYLSEPESHRVRRIDENGIITTFAGTGNTGGGGDGGPATEANLWGPRGLAIGLDGSVYIGLSGTHKIRRVSPDGIITTVAGNGTNGGAGDGVPALEAELWNMRDARLAVNSQGHIYIDRQIGSTIRRISADGIIEYYAGGGPAGNEGEGFPINQTRLLNWRGFALGPDDSLYVTQTRRVRRAGSDDIFRFVAGLPSQGFSGDGGPALEAQFDEIRGIAVSSDGTLYIRDSGNRRIRRVGSDGIIITIAGTGNLGFSGDGGPATQADIGTGPMAFGQNGDLYISTFRRIRRLTTSDRGFSASEIQVPSPDGEEVFIFNPYGKHLRTLNSLTGQILREFFYDYQGRLASVTDSEGDLVIERDGDGLITAIVGPHGARTELTLDNEGYLASTTDPTERIRQFTYDNGLMVTATDAAGNVSTYQYDEFGRLISATDPAQNEQTLSSFTEEDGTNVVLYTSALGRTTLYESRYLSTGDVVNRTIFPDGSHQTEQVGTDGVRTMSYPDGTTEVVTLGPDPRFGMLVPLPIRHETITPAGRSLVQTMQRTVELGDGPFDVLTMTDTINVDDSTWLLHYDGSLRTFTETSPEGRVGTWTIDDFGRRIHETVGNQASRAIEYDDSGRVVRIDAGENELQRTTLLSYGESGQLETVTDAAGRTFAFQHDAAGRPIGRVRPDDAVIEVSYDASGQIAQLVPPEGLPHSFTVNPLGRLANYDPPEIAGVASGVQVEYDPDREESSITIGAEQAVTYGYDGAGHLSSIGSSAGPVAYARDEFGRIVTAMSPGGVELGMEWDGQQIVSQTWAGPVAGQVLFERDGQARPLMITINEEDGIEFNYDGDGLVTAAGALMVSYDMAGQVESTVAASISSSHERNVFGELTKSTFHADGQLILEQEFIFDDIGRVSSIIEQVGASPSVTTQIQRDVLGRIIGIQRDGVTIEFYNYDINSNRIEATRHDGTISTSHDDQDRIVVHGNEDFTYAASGHLETISLGGGMTSFDYDALGILSGISLPDGREIEYLVDGFGRRIGKQVDGVFERGWIYQDERNPVAELNANGEVSAIFIYATTDHAPDLMIMAGDTFRLITDRIGSVRMVVNVETGVIAQQIDYDSFGRVLMDTAPGFQPFGFAGGLYDPDTELVRFGVRDYHPETGRWTSRDPVGFSAGQTNLYEYVGSDPISWIDPTGTIFSPGKPGKKLGGAACRITCKKQQRLCEMFGSDFPGMYAGFNVGDCIEECTDKVNEAVDDVEGVFAPLGLPDVFSVGRPIVRKLRGYRFLQ